VTPIPLPALRPTHPLGYLAALGLHRALARELEITALLSWSAESTPCAVLETSIGRDELLASLAGLWRRQAELRAVKMLALDGHRVAFPPRVPLAPASARRGERGMNDPAKMLPEEEYAAYGRAARAAGDSEAVAWVRAVATDLALDNERAPAIAPLSDLYLLSRQQTLAQQFEALWAWSERHEVVTALEQAIASWRRVELEGGMNWDIDANQNAAETPRGSPRMMIVPGATWLAMMALPYFPVRRTRGRPATRGFQTVQAGRRQWRRVFVLPAWRPSLDVAAIEALLDHPLLALDTEARTLQASRATLASLGVSVVHTVEVVARRVANQMEYYLGKSVVAAPAAR
jgi:hypothetical protein